MFHAPVTKLLPRCVKRLIVGLNCCCCRDISFGAYSDYANATDALQIWPEHRYYAEEAPYTPVDNLEHFTIEQALVDHIELVLYIQKSLNMTRNPVIAIGSSYSKPSSPGPLPACIAARN